MAENEETQKEKQLSLFPELEEEAARMAEQEERDLSRISDIGFLFENTTVEDLPNEDTRLVAQMMGLKIAVLLMKHFGGMSLSIPKKGFKRLFARVVKKHFDGSNAKRLAMAMGITERDVYRLFKSED